MATFIVLTALLFSTGFWFWLIRRKDCFAPEPFWFLAKIMLLGGMISIIPAGFLNSLVLNPQATAVTTLLWQNLFVGFNEEFWKLSATVYLIKNHHHFDEPVDGLIYAATVALGFAAIENIEYISRYGLNVLLLRHFTSVPAHLAFAMLWGYGLTLAKFKYPNQNWLSVIWPFFFLAAISHGLYNFSLHLFPEGINLAIAILFVLYLYRYNAKKITSMLLHSPLRPIGHCPACKTNSSKNSRICRRCGAALFPDEEFPLLKKKICKNCARQNVFSAKFCVQCGTKG